jgi:hypothetical protein
MTNGAVRAPQLVHLFRRLFSLPAREFGALLVAQAFLVRALWSVRRRPKGALLRPVEGMPSGEAHPGEDRLSRLVVAVDRAARYGVFRPTCLVRAVALERMIVRAGVGPAVVRVGVQRGDDRFLAHAWIELDGRVIGEEPSRVRRFTPLHDFSAVAR